MTPPSETLIDGWGGRLLRQMERSTVHVMAKRGKRIRQIAAELGHSPTTIARVLKEPVDKPPTPRRRRSQVEIYRAQIEAGIAAGLSNVRILEAARADAEQPYRGGRTVFDDLVRRVRRELAQRQAARDVPIRFAGLPALSTRFAEPGSFAPGVQVSASLARPGARLCLTTRCGPLRSSGRSPDLATACGLGGGTGSDRGGLPRARMIAIARGMLYSIHSPMRERKRIHDPYAKPWVAEDAAKNVVRNAVSKGFGKHEVLMGRADILRPDYAATVGRVLLRGRAIDLAPQEIGVSGFGSEGVVFPLPEVWQKVTGQELPEGTIPERKPKRSRQKNEAGPDAHLESQYDERQSGDPWDE